MAFDEYSGTEEIKPFDVPLMEDTVIYGYSKMASRFFASVDDYYSDQLESCSATKAPASALYYLKVYAAISSNYPTYEYFSQGQYSSVQDHGGVQMYIVTAEFGYGFSQYAKMIGNNLTMYQQHITDNGIIIAYFRWWTANGYQSGQFAYPYNTMSDRIGEISFPEWKGTVVPQPSVCQNCLENRTGAPFTVFLRKETFESPKFLGYPFEHMPWSQIRWCPEYLP